jgi:cell division protein FtsI/penicillin-binding protein 2
MSHADRQYMTKQARRANRQPGRRMHLFLAVVGVLVVVAAIAVGAIAWQRHGSTAAGGEGDGIAAPGTPGEPEATAFLAAWSKGDTATMQSLVSDPAAQVDADLKAVTAGLHLAGARYQLDRISAAPGFVPGSTAAAPSTAAGRAASSTAPAGTVPAGVANAQFTATVTIGGLGDWTYQGSLPIVVTPAGPRIVWSVADVHPALSPGLVLTRTRTVPPRAPILDGDGQPLVQEADTVVVGAEPRRITNEAALTAQVASTLSLDPKAITAALHAPGIKPDQFVPLTTISKTTYAAVKPVLYPIPGLQFQQGTSRGGELGPFAEDVLGHTAPVTAEGLQQLGQPYQAGDLVGQGGIEGAFEKTLAGTPSGQVAVVDAKGTTVTVLQHVDGTPPAAVSTTLDPKAQLAAEKALASVTKPAAIVAVDANGNIKALATRPASDDFDRALLGQYPPGSTFKTVTSAALLTAGSTADTPLTCPPTIAVDGRTFHNAENESASQMTLATAFEHSCNTAFIGAAQKLTAAQLKGAAASFGFNQDYSVGLPTKGGSYPDPADGAALSASAIGQGQDLASPVQMASVAQTVMTGQWHAPVLIPAAAHGPATPVAPLDANVRSALAQFMHLVVLGGTGTKAQVPGQDVAGKTGTAEFGNANPPQTHAWFIGFNGTYAVAAIVEGGGFGGDVAAPIVSTFLAASH